MSDSKVTSMVNKLISKPILSLGLVCLILAIVSEGDIYYMSPLRLGIFTFLFLLLPMALFIKSENTFNKIQVLSLLSINLVVSILLAVTKAIAGDIVTLLLMFFTIPLVLLFHCLYLKYKNLLNSDSILNYSFLFSFFIMTTYILYVSFFDRSSDCGSSFVHSDGSFTTSHSGYIYYLYTNWHLPDFDIRDYIQFYHPPFYHGCSALLLSFFKLFFSNGYYYECLQFFTLFCTIVTSVTLIRILKLFGVDEKYLPFASLISIFSPVFIYNCGNMNNDTMAFMFITLSVYQSIIWYRKPDYKNIIVLALYIGLGMMTKLSVGMVAFPIGFLMLFSLFSDKKSILNKTKQFAVFAIITVPLGLFYQIRNYIRFGVPLTYLYGNTDGNQYADIPVWKRFLGIYEINSPYHNFGDTDHSYNAFISLFKTYNFGGNSYDGVTLLDTLGYIMFYICVISALAGTVIGIYAVIKTIKEKKMIPEIISIIILFMSNIISYCLYSIKFPFGYTMQFRYVMPIMIVNSVFWGIFLTKSNNKLSKALFYLLFTLLISTNFILHIGFISIYG